MKTANQTLLATLAGIALSLFAGTVQAQYQPAGDDSATASPKARQFLDEYNRNHAPALATCPMHPSVKADKSGRCPIRGRNLAPAYGNPGAAGTNTPPGAKVTNGPVAMRPGCCSPGECR